MNKYLSQMTVEKDVTQADYPTLFKGIWTGVLISFAGSGLFVTGLKKTTSG